MSGIDLVGDRGQTNLRKKEHIYSKDIVGDRGQTNLRKKEHIHCDSRYGFSNYRRDRDDDGRNFVTMT